MEWSLSLSYYDRILAAIAVTLGGGAIIGLVTTVSLSVGLLIGGLVATIFIYDAMLRNPPRPAASLQGKAAAILWHFFLGFLIMLVFL